MPGAAVGAPTKGPHCLDFLALGNCQGGARERLGSATWRSGAATRSLKSSIGYRRAYKFEPHAFKF